MNNKRLSNTSVHSEAGPSQHRKSKKKSSRRSSSTVEAWHNNDSQEASEDEAPAMEYTSVYWQQPRLPQPQPCPAPNGQRLFTAMSDPSVCGYSAVPITYTMEPVSLPPMYQLFQPVVRPNYRTYRGRTRTALRRMQTGPPSSSDAMVNGYSSLQENSWNHSVPVGYQNGDYASLPPTANTDNKDNGEELNSEHRRYSDPGLKPALVPNNAKSDNSDSADSDSSITTIEKNSKLISTFIDQMTKMKEANSQLFKELHEAKTELEIVKTELNQYKQNVHSDYKPGMLSDVIKEIRDASRIKEEAMLSKVKLLIENQQSQRSADLEQFKNQLDRVWKEKEQNEQRIEKLEKEVTALRLNVVDNGEIVAFEEENLALRRELEEARASRNYAESHATKLERLMEILKEKTQAAAGQGLTATTTTSSSSNEEPEEHRRRATMHFGYDDSSKSNSANNSSNSLATGPVTDL